MIDLGELRKNRMLICKECPQKRKIATVNYCGQCGCIIAAKAAIVSEHCPLGKWENGMKDQSKEDNNGTT